jgi:hypothetical protein
MNKKHTFTTLFCILILMANCFVFASQNASGESQEKLLNEATSNTVVRFFYVPPTSYLHPPLIFRVAPSGDLRLGGVPNGDANGRTIYISMIDMQKVIAALSNSELIWERSQKPKRVEPPLDEELIDRMKITVFFSDRTFEAYVQPDKMCQALSELDFAFSQPGALWEFQLFRVQYGCQVQGFNRKAY